MTSAHVHTGTRGGALAVEQGYVAVVVDALRATGTIATLLGHGVERVFVVAEAEETFALRDALLRSDRGLAEGDVLTVGERGGVIIPGCDRGNEPVMGRDKLPPVAVFTSSNCARCCLAAREAPELMLGHCINARVVAERAARFADRLHTSVMLVPAGFADDESRLNLEDLLACGCILDRGGLAPANDGAYAALAAYRQIGAAGLGREFHLGDHGRHLDKIGRGPDIDYLASVDLVPVVPARAGVGAVDGVDYVEFA